jgi:hypothetical protein
VSRLVRAERLYDGNRLFLVAGERGVIELREYPNFWCFYVHSPVWRPEVARRTVQDTAVRRGRGSLPGLARHLCHILEGECWTGLTNCGNYDFDRPDMEEVVQWDALEDLYRRELGGN